VRKIYQNKHNNCLSACVASFLHEDIDEVPIFVETDDWVRAMESYLEQKGYSAKPINYAPSGYSIMIVKVPARGKSHAVIAKDGRIWHDPATKGKKVSEYFDGYRIDYYITIQKWY